jgi:hypothetical protein
MKNILAALILLPTICFAQKTTIKGKLVDENNNALSSATVMLLNAADSSLVNFAPSSSEGLFELKNISRNSYLLKVSYVGLGTLTRKVDITNESNVLDLGDLKMESQNKQLDEVVIQAEKAPVVIKKDTIEFNAPSFKTTEHANVEDLLKKLPGVEVDNDGSIKAQGEEVKQVTVDGKEFFGRDPKIATRNLPAKAIDKVQIFDKKSDQSTFTGIDDGQRDKTINLALKEEYKNGYFGTNTLGYGTDDRYEAKLSLNRFKKNQQLSVIGMANNINQQGFSIDDYFNFSGTSQQLMGGRGGAARVVINDGSQSQGGAQVNFGNRLNGIMSNYAGGINFNHDFSKKTNLSSNYFYNQLEHDLTQTLDRENFLPGPLGTTQFHQDSRQLNNSLNHKVNTSLDHKIDSANSVKWTTTFLRTENESNVTSLSSTVNNLGDLQNEGSRRSSAFQAVNNFNTNALLRHRFPKKGRTISANLSFGYSDTEDDGSVDAVNTFYGTTVEENITKQRNAQSTINPSYGGTLSYTEPLGNRRYLEIGYNYRGNTNKVNRSVFDIVNEEEFYNNNLSAVYSSQYEYHRPLINVKINRSKYSATLGTGVQMTTLSGDFTSQNTTLNRSYQNWVPSAHFNYDFTNTKHFSLDYTTNVQEPSITQLQPIVNNNDPLNITLGNPELRPAYMHTVNTSFVSFNPASFMSFFAFANAIIMRNAITYAQQIDGQGVRTTRPVNVDNNTILTANASLGFPVKKINSRFNVSANTQQQFGVNIINDVQSGIWQNTISSTLRYNYQYKEALTIDLSGTFSRNATEYEFNKANNQLFFNNSYEAKTSLTFLKNYQLTSSFEYLIYNSVNTNFNQEVELLDISVSRFILKNKSGEIKLSVANLLNNNIGISQDASVNYVERSVYNNLGRYFMCTFIYSLNKQLNPMSMRKGPGIRMMVR